ncbi:MAG: hypothetical protein GC185_10385 [Alphaproteobacteria bacterium]|nr:hypothetical protein [Alphaproteobacteria bacterium]
MDIKQENDGEKGYIIQCSADNFEQAAYLSAVFSDVICVNEQSHRLRISTVTDLLRKQFEKLGASIREAASVRLSAARGSSTSSPA